MYRCLLFLFVLVVLTLIGCSGHPDVCHAGCACYSYDDCPDGCVKSVDDGGKFCSEI